MTPFCPSDVRASLQWQRGLSIIELMVACAIGIIMVLAMTYVLTNSMQSRNELAKTSRQIENGRYAMEEIRREVQLAGFFGSFQPTNTVTWTTPNPCAATRSDLQFAAQTTTQSVPLALQSYAEAAVPACMLGQADLLANRVANTDVLVVRRTSTEKVEIDANGDNQIDNEFDTDGNGTADTGKAAFFAKAFYLQVSQCSDLAAEVAFTVSQTEADFTLHKVIPAGTPPRCTTGHRSEVRRYITNVFYVSRCNDCSGAGDGIPTLKMIEVSPTPVERPIAEGIQDMQLEFGIDNTSNDGVPDVYQPAGAVTDWSNVVAVKAFLLARNAEITAGYNDTKTYLMGSDGSTVGPFNDRFRRQAYVATIMANNPAGRRM